jgi:antitoxin MazE
MEIHDRGQIEPSLIGLDVSDIGEPDPVQRGCAEVPIEQVRSDRVIVLAVGDTHPLWPRRQAPLRLPVATSVLDLDRALIYIYTTVYPKEIGMQVAKWGNSLAVRLPAAVVEALGLKEGDEIEIHVADARQFGVARKPGRDELLRRLRDFRGRLPADFKFDRDEANAR